MERWADTKGEFWAERADWVTRMLAEPLEALLDGVDLKPGERVLDVGCGCGDSSVAAAEAVGPDGRVLGIDLSAAQLEVTARRAVERGLDNLEVMDADASALEVAPGSFDVLLSRLGVMFFAEPTETFARLRAALGPDGRLAFVCWQHPADNEWVTVATDAMAEILDIDLAPPGDRPGGMSFRDPVRVRSIVEGAGFGEVTIDPVSCAIDLGDDADDALDFIATMETVRVAREAASVEDDAAALGRARDALAAHLGPDGIRLGALLWLVRARA